MKKYIPNIISSARIIAGASLFLFSDVTNGFIALYVFCGITDLIDGPIARKLNATSSIGALLDTVGDIVTYMAFAKILLVQKQVPKSIVIWMLGVAAIHLIAGLVSLIKVKKFYVVHSLFGKILGGSVFVLPFAMWLAAMIVSKPSAQYDFIVYILMAIVATIGTIAGLESLIIQIKTDDPQTPLKTIYGLIKSQ
ncbi:MAG: CDP-alcohol phosphatidyltransferase family protein [Clostridia bacterium]|nr:CDP-alcohol phosphatidyltransferase family protein [Clostridia bacterium]